MYNKLTQSDVNENFFKAFITRVNELGGDDTESNRNQSINVAIITMILVCWLKKRATVMAEN